MWHEALVFAMLSVGDEVVTARVLDAKKQITALGYEVRSGENGLDMPLRITFHISFTIGGGYGVSKLEGRAKWLTLGITILAKSWIIYNNWQHDREMRRFLANARPIRPPMPGSW